MYSQINYSKPIHAKIKSLIICLAKIQGHLSNYQFLMKRTQQKIKLKKPELKEMTRKPYFETAQDIC